MNFKKDKTILGSKKVFLKPFIMALVLVVGLVIYFNNIFPAKSAKISQTENLPVMQQSELAQFDGSDMSKPIYLGFEGLVYDVTAGKEYYQEGGTYHYLAGKDSTTDLHIAGGEIIKRKYPVIAKLQP